MLVVAFAQNPEYIKQSDYTIIAFVSGLVLSIKMDEYFRQHFGLTEGIIVDEEELPVDVFFFDQVFWAAFLIFAQTNEFICTQKCLILRYPP